jgi:hypothetical protein
MLSTPSDWSLLTEHEYTELGDLAKRWLSARVLRDFATADVLRAELIEWGAWPLEDGWHPVFESMAHRYARIMARIEHERGTVEH